MRKPAAPNTFLLIYLQVWDIKDPIKNFEQFLLSKQILTKEEMEVIHLDLKDYVDVECNIGFNAKPIYVDTDRELREVYAENKLDVRGMQYDEEKNPTTAGAVKEQRFIDAIKEGLHQSMQEHADLVLMGQDIAEYGVYLK